MTFLRWAGSKKQLLDTLACCWYAAGTDKAEPSRYIEAFSGSAALFFALQPRRALLVDINVALQECMHCVKHWPLHVATLLRRYSCTEEEYYSVRSADESKLTPIERAARFIYLNRNCFNGLYRTNLQGRFNVPYGRSKKSGRLPSEADLAKASRVLQSADLLTGDFYGILSPNIEAGDFIYLDPPYAKVNASLDNQYGPDVFGTQDLMKLDHLAESANERGASFVISYADCEEVQFLAKKWRTHRVNVQRTIAAKAQFRSVAQELLITNI